MVGMGDLLVDINAQEFETHLILWPPDDHAELNFLRALSFGNLAHQQKLDEFEARFVATPYGGTLPDLDDIYPEWLRRPQG